MKISELKKKIIEKFGEGYWKKFTNSEAYKTYTASKEKQLELIKNNPFAIDYINNPSEDLQLEVIKQNGYAIEYINNPTEKVQLEAVREIITSIRYINNPTDKVIQELIEKIDIDNTCNFKYILRFLENDLKEEREEQTIKLYELKNMTLEQIKELLNKSIEEETNE